MAGGSSSALELAKLMESGSNFFRGGNGGGSPVPTPNLFRLFRLLQEPKKVLGVGRRTWANMLLLPAKELLRSWSKKTLTSEFADTGGVEGVLGEMGGEVVDSCSDSVILLKLIL